MKTKVKAIGCIVLNLSLLLMAVSCFNSESRIKLKEGVAEMNQRCPMAYDMATLIGATVEDDNVVFNYVINEEKANIKIYQSHPEKAKKYLASLVFTDENAEFTNLIITAGYGFVARYKGSKTKSEAKLEMTNDDIKYAKQHPQSYDEMLDWQIELTNSMMPMEVDDYTILNHLDKQGDNVIYYYDVDDQRINMDVLTDEKAMDEFRNGLLAQLTEASSNQSVSRGFMKILRRSGKNLVYQYRGKMTGKEMKITFSNDELREIGQDFIE